MMRALGALLSTLVLLLSSGIAHADIDPRDFGYWAGYVARNDDDPAEFFTSISAEWVVTPAKCFRSKDLYGAWVGLGGGTKTDDWLIQIGTVTDCKTMTPDGQPKFSVFREAVRPTPGPAAPQTIYEVPVRVNDRIYAEVVFDNEHTYHLKIKNMTLDITFLYDYEPLDVQPTSAEAVIEAKPQGFGLYPQFSPMTFQDVRVDGQPISRHSPEKWDAFRKQNRANLQAIPGPLVTTAAGDDGFLVFWKHE